MKSKITKLVQYGVPLAVIIVILIGYTEARNDYKDTGKVCSTYAFEEASKIDGDRGIVISYEPLYLSCMRSFGYLLKSVATLREN